MSLGEYPEFSDDARREIRQEHQRALWQKWQRLHAEKNITEDQNKRDRISADMRALEAAMERLKNL